jgi:3-hydroxyacyl-[acyl-carrier-protein] dehydratase
LLVDRVRDIDPFKSAIGVKNVTINEPYFPGHFPSAPVMPGVMIVEAMAQTAGVMVGASAGMADQELLIYFVSIDKCKFRRKVGPGDVLHMHMTTLRGKPGGKFWKFAGRAEVDGDIAAEVEFGAMLDMGTGTP